MNGIMKGTLIVALLALTLSLEAKFFFENDEVINLSEEGLNRVFQSPETWIVKFYSPDCGWCQELRPKFKNAAAQLKGVARFAAIDVVRYPAMKEKYGIQLLPTVKVFTGEPQSLETKKRVIAYFAAESTKALVKAGVKYVHSYVDGVTSSNFSKFLSTDGERPHFLLLSDSNVTLPAVKGLSGRYLSKANFGELNRSDDEGGAIAKKLKVTELPSLVAFKAGSSIPEAEILQGNFSSAEALSFVEKFAGVIEEKNEAEPIISDPPREHSPDMWVIQSSGEFNESCVNRGDKRYCCVLFMPNLMWQNTYGRYRELGNKYKLDHLAFFAIDSTAPGGSPELAKAFGVDDPRGGYICVRPKKKDFARLKLKPSLEGLWVVHVDNFLMDIVDDSHKFYPLPSPLPDWSVEIPVANIPQYSEDPDPWSEDYEEPDPSTWELPEDFEPSEPSEDELGDDNDEDEDDEDGEEL